MNIWKKNLKQLEQTLSALKNLTKLLFCIAVILAKPSYSQILGIGINFEKLNLPEPFLQKLSTCSVYKFSQTATADGIEAKTTYSVKPTKNNTCLLHIEGHTNVSVHISQDCELSLAQAKTYSEALRRYQAKEYSPRWNGNKIAKDADYLRAYEIMSDRKICRFVRQEIDHTSTIRQNLSTCNPAKQDEITATIKVERQILQKQDDKCFYTFKITQLARTDSAPTNKSITFNCRLNPPQQEQYLEILANLVIPEEEGYDFSTVQRISVAEELNFILDNCDLDTAAQ